MRPAVSRICGQGARACLAMCLHLSSTVVTRIAVVCCTDLCGSLPWTDHCFGHHIGSLLAQFGFVDHCFGRLFCQFCTQPFPPLIGSGSWLVSGQVSFSHEVPQVWWCWLVAACRAGSCSQGCHGTYLLCLVFVQGPHQPWWHQFPSSSIGNEFK